ncbi:hypothetical protein GGI35DRAFT_447809 [Trichoderma velutinum]
MPDQSRLDRVYAGLLRQHPYGWALYKKLTRRDIFPGSCGYFDSDGDWHTLVDLIRQSELTSQGWSPPSQKISNNQPPQSMIWGPKVSGGISSSSVGGTVGSTLVVAPIQASVTMLFENKSEQGTVLTTESPVLRHSLDQERAALHWMMDNEEKMLEKYGDLLKQHGIWIVTKTYSTRRAAIAIMTTKSSAVEIGLQADLQGVLTLTPKSSWSNSNGSSCMEIHEDESDGVVVFISGICFTKKVFWSRMSHVSGQDKQEGKFLRGDDDDGTSNVGDVYETIKLGADYWPPLDDDDDDDDEE